MVKIIYIFNKKYMGSMDQVIFNKKKSKKQCKKLYRKTIKSIKKKSGYKKISYKQWLELYMTYRKEMLEFRREQINELLVEKNHLSELINTLKSENEKLLKENNNIKPFDKNFELKKRFKNHVIYNQCTNINDPNLPFVLLGDLAVLYELIFDEKIDWQELIFKPEHNTFKWV